MTTSKAAPRRLWRGAAMLVATSLLAVGGATAPASAAVTYYSLTGSVLLANSVPAPVGDVLVEWTVAGQAHNPANVVGLDSPGHFTIPSLPNGKYYNLFYKYVGSGGYGSTYNNACQPSMPVWSLSFDNGSSWPLTISGTAASVAATTLWKTGSVNGVVSLGTASTHAGAGQVSVSAAYNPSGSGKVWSPVVLTDADGAFTIPALPGCELFQLHFDYQGDNTYLDSDSAGFNVTPGGVIDKSVTLAHGGTVSGIVSLGTAGNLAPAGSITASLTTYADYVWTDYPASMLVGADGSYSFGLLPAGVYSVKFTYTGSGYRTVSSAPPFSSPGDVVQNYAIAPYFSMGGHVYFGDTSSPAQAGEILVEVWNYSSLVLTAATLDDGSWSASPLVAGEYYLRYVYTGTSNSAYYSPPGTVTLSGNTSAVDVTLPALNSFSGTVEDSAGNPLSGVEVSASRYADTGAWLGDYSATSRADGSYRIRGLPDGSYTIIGTKTGFANGYFGEPEFGYYTGRHVLSGNSNTSLDPLVMYRSASISGTVKGVTAAELQNLYVYSTLYRFDEESGEWAEHGSITVDAATYSWQGIRPGSYAVVVYYDGPRGYAQKISNVFDIEEDDAATFNVTLAPAPPLYPSTLVRIGSGTTVYFLDGYERLIPIRSLSVASDMGISTYVRSVSTQLLTDYGVSLTPATSPLSNVVDCYGELALASGGELIASAPSSHVLESLPSTQLSDDSCDELYYSLAEISGDLALTAGNSGAVYHVVDGIKHRVIGPTAPYFFGTPAIPYWDHPVSATFMSMLPLGKTELLPGALVQVAGTTSVYLVDGDTGLVPVSNLDTAQDLNFSKVSIWTVSSADLVGRTKAAPLKQVVNCGDNDWWITARTQYTGAVDGPFGAAVSAASVAGLPFTQLQASTCAPRDNYVTAYAGTTALIAHAYNSPANYYIADGVKRLVASPTYLAGLAAPATPVLTAVPSTFLASIPDGPAFVLPGTVVKAPNAFLYLVTSDSTLARIRTLDSVGEMGLSKTAVAVSAATVTSRTVDAAPLSNVVDCAGTLYLAMNAKLWATTTAVVGSLPVTVLSADLCAKLPKSATALPSNVLVKSPSAATVFVLTDGTKRAVLNAAQLVTLGGATPVIFTVNSAFVASVPSGPDVTTPGTLVKASNGTTVYLVNSATELIPVRALATLTEMGRPTAVTTVSPGTITGMSVNANVLSNLVDCSGVTYLAVQSKLWPIAADIVGALPVSVLSSEVCATTPKSLTALVSPLLIRSVSQPNGYYLHNGVKSEVQSRSAAFRVYGLAPIVALTLNDAWVASVPTTAPLR